MTEGPARVDAGDVGTVVIFSCVGGGPMQRLADTIRHEGGDGRVVAELSDERWRGMMAGGRFGRLRARLRAMLVYPLRAVVETARLPRDAVAVPTTNPFFLPMVLVATQPIHRRRVVPLVYDLYPDALEATGLASRSGGMSRLARLANRYWFRGADGVVFIGEKMATHARDRYGEPRREAVIETGASTAEFDGEGVRAAPVESDIEAWCQGKVVAAYVGNMGAVHDWETLADAIPRVLADPRAVDFAVVVAASGPGVEQLRKRWSGLDPDRVRFEVPLPDRAWARLLVRSTLSLVTLRPAANRTSIPSKTFSAMAAGAAVVAIAPRDSDLAAVIERHRCGVNVMPGDVDSLVEVLATLTQDRAEREGLGTRARTAMLEHYDMPVLARRWIQFLGTVRHGPENPSSEER